MLKKSLLAKIEKLANHHGFRSQSYKAAQELRLLVAACGESSFMNHLSLNFSNTLAYSLVLLSQIMYLEGIEWSDIEKIMNRYADAQLSRIEDK